MQKHLRLVRLLFATFILLTFAWYFLNKIDLHLPHGLAHLQVLPAIMLATVGGVVPLLVLLVLTLLFGRVYCSFLCPLGILQDAISRLGIIFAKRFGKKKKFKYEQPRTITRYAILAAVVLAWIVGFNAVVTLLDPYGAFGRIGANLLRPLANMVNNLLALVFNAFGNYTFYNVSLKTVSISSAVVAAITLLVVGVFAWRRGRDYCNTICPVGTLLGWISRFSFFRIKINADDCNHCALCASRCKSSCIDAQQQTVDTSRCVACYNCLKLCKQNAISLQWAYKKSAAAQTTVADKSKRSVLSAGLAATAMATLSACSPKAPKQSSKDNTRPVMPPGAVNLKHFQNRCTACHLCVTKCPAQCLKPTFLEYGVAGVMQPAMDYRVGFCAYDCTVCSRVCPNGALEPMSKEEKHDLQIGKALFEQSRCVVFTDETDCGACSEHCPTQAVHMVAYKKGLRIPEVNTDLCLGCGGCQYICPVRPKTAIFVTGNTEQIALNMKTEAPEAPIQVDDFGF